MYTPVNRIATPVRINFAASDKLKAEMNALLGHEVQEIFITDSDIRHIKNEHGEKQELQGQVDITRKILRLFHLL